MNSQTGILKRLRLGAMVQEMQPDWGMGLPLNVLGLVARGCDSAKAMREVSRTWQVGFEESVTKIKIVHGSPSPGPCFSYRFPKLASLILAHSVDPSSLENLKGSKLSTLVFAPNNAWSRSESELRDADLAHLKGLPLTQLDLSYCSKITGFGLVHLKGAPLSSLCLHMCCEIWGSNLAALGGFPLTSLSLLGCKKVRDDDLKHLRGFMPAGLGLGSKHLIDSGRVGSSLGAFSLIQLDLRGCSSLSDAGLEASLPGMPLKILKVDRCSQRLRCMMPKTTIERLYA